MKRKLFKHILVFIVLIITLKSYGQQDPMFTQYMNNPVLLNPAYAGSSGFLNFNGVFRKQWVGFEWQPTTTSFSVTSPFLNYQVGVGGTFLYDKIGPLTQTGIYVDYAYHLDVDQERRLSFGLKTGFNYYQKDLRGLTSNESDQWVETFPLSSKFLFNVGLGIYYSTQKYYVGASIPKLIRNSLSEGDNTNIVYGKEERHYFVTGGGIFDISTILKFKPSFMVRIVNGAAVSNEITATLIAFERVWGGLMYRFGDAAAAHIRFEVYDGFQIGYSYDLTNSRLKSYNNGTHEVFLSYTIKKKGRRILSPRYF